ncbi:hypothetical protein [Caulobacter sp. NIBR1757]|uniref:hypothetical protein n=1 Tax=Caulobacter sp. NIBR1757 TaxID=3016000 RepID=UPI0022F0AC70|nr:hypothetical protein [Caulobacter sp. NIBR1757]WGM39245.1 hypothetical protein AMEJIAPC_02162 [Caulobacter sp. NIBR1757]
MRASHLLLLVFGVLALGGCENLVQTEQPILTSADAAPEWTVRPGIWTQGVARDAACPFEIARSVRNWPECADFIFVEKPALSKAFAAEGNDQEWLLAEADPGLYALQTTSSETESNIGLFFVTREKQDATGAATRVGFGMLFCGPEAPEGTTWPNREGRVLTLEPFEGAILDGKNCRPDGKAGLFALVRANRDAGAMSTLVWRRDVRRDEIGLLRRRAAKAAEAARRRAAQSTIAE